MAFWAMNALGPDYLNKAWDKIGRAVKCLTKRESGEKAIKGAFLLF